MTEPAQVVGSTVESDHEAHDVAPDGRDPLSRSAVLLSRCRFPILLAGLGLLVGGTRLGVPGPLAFAGFGALYVLTLRAGTVRRKPIMVRSPVRGRWRAINSPHDRVPSHGVQFYGQTYAVDLIHEPTVGPRPTPRTWPLARPAQTYPSFGQPILAVAPGVVIRACGRSRDHWSRDSWPAMLFLLVEGMLRELTGPGRILGNHVVVRHDDGSYGAYAHLQRKSLRVGRGDRVEEGQVLAGCGNSGNSSEPHLHVQLMDHRYPVVAAGLPMAFTDVTVDGVVRREVPGTATPFEAA